MTEKERAIELYRTFYDKLSHTSEDPSYYAKECALICVEEILKSLIICANNVQHGSVYDIEDVEIPYWQEVKQEIEKL